MNQCDWQAGGCQIRKRAHNLQLIDTVSVINKYFCHQNQISSCAVTTYQTNSDASVCKQRFNAAFSIGEVSDK